MPFTEHFDRYATEGDSITCEIDGITYRATLYRDDCGGRPDERDDGFWPSLDEKSAGWIGPKSKATLARHTARAQEVMDAWKRGDWFYCGIAVTAEFGGHILTGPYLHAVWGVECNYPTSRKKERQNAYLQDVANELLPDCEAEATAALLALVDAGQEVLARRKREGKVFA